ncbi:ankyrin repeat protein [Trichoderma sp. SZMC 28013]
MLLEHDITGATLLSEDYYGQIPLHCAAKRGFTDVVRFLIGKMKNNAVMETDARQRTALHLAAGYGSEAVVRLLLDTATDKGFVDSLDETGMTALHWATIGRRRNGSYIKVMEVLLERGADVNIKGGADDKTAINHARDNQDEERIAVLLRADKIAR